MDVRLLHSQKVLGSILVKVLGIITETIFPHLWKADSPIVVTLEGISIEVSPELKKAPCPIFVTLVGIVTEVKLMQPINTHGWILVIVSGKVTCVTSTPLIYRKRPEWSGLADALANWILHQAVMSSMLTMSNPEQPINALFPILVTLLGILMYSMLVRFVKAFSPIEVTW